MKSRALPGYFLVAALLLIRVAGEVQAEPVLTIAFDTTVQYLYNVDRPDFATQLEREAPFATLLLAYEADNGTAFEIAADAQREWNSRNDFNVPIGGSGNPVPVENNLVTLGVVRLPVGDALVTFGRQPLHLGPDRDFTLSASQRLPYLDALTVEVPIGRLELLSVTSTIENRRASPDVSTGVPRDGYDFGQTTIFYNIHYFSYELPRIEFGIGSQMVIAREFNDFQLGDFFPVFSWHNADITPNNMCLITHVSGRVLPDLRAYLQIGLDDINAGSVGVSDSGVPTIDAYIAGVEYDLHPWIRARLSGGYTHYLWGSFDDDEYLSRAIFRFNADENFRSMPLTSPFGPGALWLESDASIDLGSVELRPRLRFLGLKPVDLTGTAYAASSSVEAATRSWRNEVSVSATYSPFPLTSFEIRPALGFGSGDVEFSLEASGRIRMERTAEGAL